MKTVIIIEDEKDAKETLKEYLSSYPELAIIAECENGKDAIEKINKLCPDILFLDIHLPGINGFQVMEQLTHKPAVVITSAFGFYAAKAFNYEVLDYLLKPFCEERFAVAMKKVRLVLSGPTETSQ